MGIRLPPPNCEPGSPLLKLAMYCPWSLAIYMLRKFAFKVFHNVALQSALGTMMIRMSGRLLLQIEY
jgi:hypothetical protein